MINFVMPIVVVGRLRVRSPEFMPLFGMHALQSYEQAKTAEGCLATNVFEDQNLTFWNCTMWESEAALINFMRFGAHGKAMPDLATTCSEAVTVRWEQATATLPTWLEAHQKIVQFGRASKLNFPSPAQETRDFPLPVAVS
ncbi:MAG: hypothetical protein RLZZ156_1001 [Deinococcota bacterium]|jgi:hypothetical protein